MDLWHSMGGMITVRLTCADAGDALTAIRKAGIQADDIYADDPLTLQITIRQQNFPELSNLAEKRGYELTVRKKMGLYWKIIGLLKRPVLLLGLIAILALGLYLPTKVLFVQVEGNAALPSREILQVAEELGVCFGSDREAIRSEKIKNGLLQRIPELQWAGINTYGCVAVISVRERQVPQQTVTAPAVGSIVAIRDGVVTQATVLQGTPSCKIGDAVKEGQVLISGYTDCGISIRAQCAKGEVFAQTMHTLEVVTPLKYDVRKEMTASQTKYSLIIGKKRINLYFGSGILDTGCVKMYEENYLTLPGGFQLPIAIATETWYDYGFCPNDGPRADYDQMLSDYAQRYLSDHMVAGHILHAQETVDDTDGVSRLMGEYICIEMIGKLRSEEIFKPNG